MPAPPSPLQISVLALLVEAPMHPYEMYRLLIERHEDRVVKVRPGSLYRAVDQLAAEGLIEATGTGRAGGRPERTTYQVTPAGSEALQRRLRELLATPFNEYPRFLLALGEAHNLPRTEVIELLGTRIELLQAELDHLDEHLGAAAERTPEAFMLDWFHLRDMLTAELALLRRLVLRLDRKELSWPLDDLR